MKKQKLLINKKPTLKENILKIKRLNHRHYICIAITLGFLACAIFAFPNAIGRLIEGGRDLGLSLAYYFCELFHIEYTFVPTVNTLPKFPFFDNSTAPVPPIVTLPDTFPGLKNQWTLYWQAWASLGNLKGYLKYLNDFLYTFCQILLIVIPFIFALYTLFKRYFENENNDYNKDSRVLKMVKSTANYTYMPIKKYVVSFIKFLKTHKNYLIIWAVIWSYSFNFFTILLEFFAFYFYFVMSFDVGNIYRQVYKLFIDLSVAFSFVPWWGWVIVAIVVVNLICKKIAYARLNHYEMKNRGFINARPIVFMVCGTMGKKKTTAITDMALSQSVMFRDKAFEKLLENDLKFPYFPWINLENEIKNGMKNHCIYNLATCKKFVYDKQSMFLNWSVPFNCFSYDFKKYGLEYNDKLQIVDLWQVIENYTQLYFIYILESSLLISNYSIRVDDILADLGNFPMWDNEFFKRDSRLIDSYSRHAHILDFDSLRLGRKLVENNPTADSFEFGVVVITEVGKERGNSVELQGLKKNDDVTNQKNDLFNSWLKMVRHSATVDFFPFVKVITDEQRPESWGADARDLCEIVHIKESGDVKLALSMFGIVELAYSWLFNKFSNLYHKYRFIRSDNSLPMYMLKSVSAKFNHYYNGIYNKFGYCKLRVQLESGTQDGQIEENDYYLMSKKIYAKRFSTDCFSDYFVEKALRSTIGIDDILEYMTEKATLEEMKEQNSYFIGSLLNHENKNTENNNIENINIENKNIENKNVKNKNTEK